MLSYYICKPGVATTTVEGITSHERARTAVGIGIADFALPFLGYGCK